MKHINAVYLLALYVLLLVLPASAAHADPPPTVPITQGTPAPFTGILFSPTEMAHVIDTASRAALLQTRVTTLEANLAAVEQSWSTQLTRCRDDVTTERAQTAARVARAAEIASQRTWWERNGVWVTLAGGLIVGAGATTAVFLLLPRGP